MKPKTKLEKRIVQLTLHLKDLTEEQKEWGKNQCFSRYLYFTKKDHVCMECGETWSIKEEKKVCPKCHSDLLLWTDKGRTRRDWNYFSILDTIEGLQVIRYIYIEKSIKARTEADYTIREVCQHWITEKGKTTIMAFNNQHSYYNKINWSVDNFSIKGVQSKYYFFSHVYPKRKIIKNIRRNGFKRSFYDIHESVLFQNLLKYPIAETLLKTKQYTLLRYFVNSNISRDNIIREWNSIKIAIRHNYTITNASMWGDYITLLKAEGKDIRSPEHICPFDLDKEHQKYVDRRNKRMEAKRKEDLIKEIEHEEKVYVKKIKKFKGIQLRFQDIVITPIQTVMDVYQEGLALHHCVYHSGYHREENNLLLSARKGSQRLETIALDLENMQVEQCRGLQNTNTDQHNLILNIINSNMNLITKIKTK